MFRALSCTGFPPFGTFQLELPAVPEKPADLGEVHLFTGVNGTGKTRLLSVLAAALGNTKHLAKRLKGMEEQAVFRVTDVFPTSPDKWTQFQIAGNDVHWHNERPIAQWARTVPAFAYSGMPYLADAPIAVMADVPKPDRAFCLSFVRPEEHSKVLLQAITNLKLQAAMDSMNDPDEPTRATRIVRALEKTISDITRLKFLFHVTTYPKTDLRVRWAGTELSFDVLPDGLRSLIGWMIHAVVMMDVWLQGKGDPLESEAVFLLDEIESPLHPAWQRRILPAFQRLFPNSQIFMATHSPFVIASLNHGWIHPLTLDATGKAHVEQPIPASEGDSYISVVEDIMGLKEWYDPETEGMLEQFRTHRDAAYRGDDEAQSSARQLAAQIGRRSMELDYMMGKELSQMDRQLTQMAPAR